MSSYSTALIRFVFLNPENKNKINPLLLCCLHPVGSDCRGKITAPLSLSVSVKGSRWHFSLLIGTTESWSAYSSKCFLLVNPSTVSLYRVVKVRWLGREGPPFLNAAWELNSTFVFKSPVEWNDRTDCRCVQVFKYSYWKKHVCLPLLW